MMQKRLLSVYIITIVAFVSNGCSQTDADISVAETEPITNAAERDEQITDSTVLQEESESEKDIDHVVFNTYRSILEEYGRAWEDEAYTIEEWQAVAGVFKTLTDAKFQLETKEKDYELYYCMSDLTGNGAEELIIGVQDGNGIAPCFLYSAYGERIHITDSRTGDNLTEKPTILYENGMVESTECIRNGMYRYNFYQLSKDSGEMKKIDQYFYIEDSENGTQYYRRDMGNTVTEEEFWNGIGDYESMPQMELDWNKLECFWESEEKDEPLTVMSKKIRFDIDGSVHMWEEYEYDSAGNMTKYTGYLGGDGSFWFGHEYEYNSKNKLTKDTYYGADGDIEYRNEYEYDHTGNQVKHIRYDPDDSIHMWEGYEYDSAGNQVKYTSNNADDSIRYWEEYRYNGAGNQVKCTRYDADGNINYWYEYEYDSTGNQTKTIEYRKSGDIASWYEWEYDSAGNMTKKNDNFQFVDEYEYDDAGNQTKHSHYSDGRLHMWAVYEYDSAGNQTYGTTYNADGSIQSTQKYEYDARGNKTRAAYDYIYGIPTGHESEHEWEYIWEYDSMGNLTKYMEYWWGEVFDRYEYEYITI